MEMTMSKIKPITTDKQLKALKPKSKPYDVRFKNISGLFIRVGKKSKSFKWDRGAGNKPRIITYGSYPAMGLTKVRELHEKAQEQHQAGVFNTGIGDAPKTISELADLFYEKSIVGKRVDTSEPESMIRVHIKPKVGGVKLATATPPTVRALVEPIIDAGYNSRAIKVLSLFKQMIKFAITEGYTENNFASAYTNKTFAISDKKRKRFLADNEFKPVWEGVSNYNSLVTATALKLLMLLGTRTGELRQAQWEGFDAHNKTLSLRAETIKGSKDAKANGDTYIVPLSGVAVGLIEELRGLDDVYIFAGKNDNEPLSKKTITKAVTRIRGRIAVAHFTTHDLRRSCRTHLSILKVDYVVIEKCLNHSLSKLSATDGNYNHDNMLDDRRKALELWTTKVMGLVNPDITAVKDGTSNVVSITDGLMEQVA